jgi:CspA family cold shock protein
MKPFQGTVKRFSNAKGYGFLECDNGEPDVFVHYRSIQTDTHKSLKKGAIVRFTVVQGPRGPQADWVVADKLVKPAKLPKPAQLLKPAKSAKPAQNR